MPLRAYVMLSLGVLLGLGLPALRGQEVGTPGLQLTYERQNNFTYGARINLLYRWEQGRYSGEARLFHDNLMNTRRTGSPFVLLLVRGHVWQHYRLRPQWSLSSWIETDQFWTTQNQRYQVYAGATWEPSPALRVRPLIGYSWDYRSGQLDQGLTPALAVSSRYDWGDGLTMETEFFGRVKYIEPRHQRNVTFLSRWNKRFGEEAALSLEVQAGSNQMDDYKSASIERIKSDSVAASLSWQYRLMPGLIWTSQSELLYTRRAFDYDRYTAAEAEFNDLRFGQPQWRTRQQVSFRRPQWDGAFTFAYETLNRAYDLDNSRQLPEREFERLVQREAQKDYFRRQTALDLQLNYRPAPRQVVSLTGTNRYLQYDTPAADNFDDHDELNYGLSLEWQASWTRTFSTRYRLLGNVRRYAFLFSERSQDNYTQPTLRLDFGYQWQVRPQLRISGEQVLYVTYNVKDFEDRNRTDRSTRNLETRLEMEARPAPRWDMSLSLYRRELHVSYLNWAAFTETPLDTTVTYLGEWRNAWQRPTAKRIWHYTLEAGYKHFSQLRYFNTSMINLENILTPINLHNRSHQTGPVTGAQVRRRGRGSLSLSVWWQLQYQDFRYREIARLTTLSTGYREADLRRAQVNFRPFLKLEFNLVL